MPNPNDTTREQILLYFYERNQNATSERGTRGSHVKISDVKRELKAAHGLRQEQVMAQLNYLVSSGWVARTTEERSFRTPRGTHQPSTGIWYSITAEGIDKVEGQSSDFMRCSPYSNVNITSINSAVQLGSGNVVRESFSHLARELEELSQAISEAPLTEDEKLSYIAEVETINSQLAKPTPDKSILRTAWNTLADSKLASVVQSIVKIGKLIEGITA